MTPNPLQLSLTVMALLSLAACATSPARPPTGAEQRMVVAAGRGGVEDMLSLAERYEKLNDRRAVLWYERAAVASPWTFRNTAAEEALGRIWDTGVLAHDDSPHIDAKPVLRASARKAERAYLAAAHHGRPGAMLELAKFHRARGDAADALRWDLRATVYRRYPSSSSNLPGAIAPEDGAPHALVRDIQRRAMRGDAQAQVDLGALYEKGMGLERDPAQALHWYRLAADQGNVFGQYFTGLLLGRAPGGVTRDVEGAAHWFAKAEAQHFFLAGEAYWRKDIEPAFFRFE